MFKLICALGNSNIQNIKELVRVFAGANVWMFDVSPFMYDILCDSLSEYGYQKSDYKCCVSIPSKGDAHGKKSRIIKEKCKKCKKCEINCLQDAIRDFEVIEDLCIGCLNCYRNCEYGAIEHYDKNYFAQFDKLIEQKAQIDCVELHASVLDEKLILNNLEYICSKHSGVVSFCISSKLFSHPVAYDLIKKAQVVAKNNKDFYVQADGNSMNLASCDKNSSLEAVEFAKYLKEQGFDEKKIIISGGVNEHTKKLCKELDVSPLALAFGTYARNKVKGLAFTDALEVAKDLVKSVEEV